MPPDESTKKRRLFLSSMAYDRKHSAGACGPIINPAADDVYSIAEVQGKKQPLFTKNCRFFRKPTLFYSFIRYPTPSSLIYDI
jgi:hypothetical protein